MQVDHVYGVSVFGRNKKMVAWRKGHTALPSSKKSDAQEPAGTEQQAVVKCLMSSSLC